MALVSRSACGLMVVVSNHGDEVVACVGAGWSVKRGEVLVDGSRCTMDERCLWFSCIHIEVINRLRCTFCVFIVCFPTASTPHCCRRPLMRRLALGPYYEEEDERSSDKLRSLCASNFMSWSWFSFLLGWTMPMCFNFRRAFSFPTLPNLPTSFVGGRLELK